MVQPVSRMMAMRCLMSLVSDGVMSRPALGTAVEFGFAPVGQGSPGDWRMVPKGHFAGEVLVPGFWPK